MKKRLWKPICALCLVTLLLSGCWQEEPEPQELGLLPLEEEQTESKPGTVLPASFSLPYLAKQTLDPITCADGAQQVVGALLYEGLFQLDQALEPQNVLCAEYTYDPAAFTYRFTLRPGVTFTDGTALTAADVVQTLRRAMASDRYSARLAAVSSVSAADGAVVITLTGPNTAFPALLDIPIVKAGTENQLVPVGTGPYVFSSEGGSAALTVHAAWWQGKAMPTDHIDLVEASDQDTILYRFTSHDVQLITADLTGTTPASVTGSIRFQDADTTTLQYVLFNTQRAPFDSAALRAALSKGLQRDSVISSCLSGHGLAAQFPVSPASPLYPEELEALYSYDAFAGAMESAGFRTGETQSATLLVNSENSFKLAAAERIAAALSDFDLKIEVRALPWEEYLAALEAGAFDLCCAEVRLTADWDLSPLLATGGALNYSGWTDARTDQLLESYAASDQRSAAMEALCSYLQTQAPILPVCFKSTSVLVQNGVIDGLTPTMANPLYDFSSCTIHLAQDGKS